MLDFSTPWQSGGSGIGTCLFRRKQCENYEFRGERLLICIREDKHPAKCSLREATPEEARAKFQVYSPRHLYKRWKLNHNPPMYFVVWEDEPVNQNEIIVGCMDWNHSEVQALKKLIELHNQTV